MKSKSKFKTPPLLVIDLGNTQLKWAAAVGARVGEVHDAPSRPGGVAAAARSWSGFKRAVVASVVPRLNPLLLRKLSRAGVRWIHFVSPTSPLGVGIDYPNAESIGPDRLANAAACRHFYGAPCVAVDLGTAVTFDIVNPAGDYVGGVICPGLRTMTDALHEQTALLPKITLAEPAHRVGKNTVEAMRIGAVVGYRGMIAAILQDLRVEMRRRRVPVVATGGHSSLIARKLAGITAVRPKLTLEGLALIGERLR